MISKILEVSDILNGWKVPSLYHIWSFWIVNKKSGIVSTSFHNNSERQRFRVVLKVNFSLTLEKANFLRKLIFLLEVLNYSKEINAVSDFKNSGGVRYFEWLKSTIQIPYLEFYTDTTFIFWKLSSNSFGNRVVPPPLGLSVG